MIFRLDKAGSSKEGRLDKITGTEKHLATGLWLTHPKEPACFLRISVTSSPSSPVPALLGSGLGIQMCRFAVDTQFNSSEPIRTHYLLRAERVIPRGGGVISPFANPRSPVLRTGRMLSGPLVQLSSPQAAHWDELVQFKTFGAPFPSPEILIKLVGGQPAHRAC